MYEFDIQVGDTRLPPLVFAEEIKNWNFIVDDPFRGGQQEDSSEQLWGLEKQDAESKAAAPVLAPFELAGPVDLWISDGKQMRLALPVSSLPYWSCIHGGVESLQQTFAGQQSLSSDSCGGSGCFIQFWWQLT